MSAPDPSPNSANPRWWRFVAPLLVALPAGGIAWHPLANNDLPLHLAIGDWVRAHGIPATDPFSFTAGGTEWVPHEWLSGVLFSWVHELAGSSGLVALAIGLSSALSLFAWRIARDLGVSSEETLLWLLPVSIMIGPRLILRPHLIALPLAFAVAWLLLRGRVRTGYLWATVPALALWGNLHGSYPFGVALVVGAMIFGRDYKTSVTTRILVAVAAVATVLAQLHVYSHDSIFAGLRHTLDLGSDPVFTQEIAEWQSPLSSKLFQQSYGYWLSIPLALAVAVAAYCGKWRTRPLWYGLFVLGSFALYLKSQRFLALFAPLAIPFLPQLPLPANGTARIVTRVVVIVATLGLTTLFVVKGLPFAKKMPFRAPGSGWSTRHLALREIDELVQRNYEGGVLCEYHYGGVLAWRGQGKIQPTMDSRNTVYGAERYLLHRGALEAENYAPYFDQLRARTDAKSRKEVAKLERAYAYLHDLLDDVGAVLIRDAGTFPSRKGLHEFLVRSEAWEPVAGTRGGAILYLKQGR